MRGTNSRTHISRRNLFAVAAASPVALGGSLAAARVDPLPGLLAEWRWARRALYAAAEAPGGENCASPECLRLAARVTAIEEQLLSVPPMSAEGVAALLAYVIEDAEEDMISEGHRKALQAALSAVQGGTQP